MISAGSTLGGVVFDTAALTAWAHRVAYVQSVVWATADAGHTIIIPATALAAARALIPPGRLDILAVLLDLPNTVIQPLDRPASDQLGAALADRIDADALIPAGHATIEAVSRDWPCLTDRPDTLRKLDPRIQTDTLP
ncbi:hypothetical protein GFY24_24900 [Nocardia sp. SYP-A9097]|uniref:hypothetical protein n=1 Tax=Nocardia sp. SYP-A9097 TaxID=2663237 RepID=UPI00129BB83B|nr:hypothetical protein [Nocardia sp. SYP-A9097]MRH90640.1 hypothetical protein [Nocardia sp. SYP-A9097]